MTRSRVIAAVAAAFVVSNVLAALVHGFVLAADYLPFEGTLLRGTPAGGAAAPPWQMIFLPVVHLSMIGTLVWIHGRIRLEGSTLSRGLAIGLVNWTMGEAPMWLRWYAEQPWPGDLLVKQLSLELVSSLIIGLTIAFIAQPRARQVSAAVELAH